MADRRPVPEELEWEATRSTQREELRELSMALM
jgi:hypothetical protein